MGRPIAASGDVGAIALVDPGHGPGTGDLAAAAGAYDPHVRSTPDHRHMRRPKGQPDMTTYQHAAPAPARRGGLDAAAWALIAIVVAVVCAFAGWAIARNNVMGRDDVARNAALAAQDGLVRGTAVGYRQGSRQGRREARIRTRAQVDAARRQASREGYAAGYGDGRARAGDPEAYLTAGASTGTYPPAGFEDILAAGLFGGDAPGYSDSAYDSYGYGTGTTTPYEGTTASLPTAYGDSYLG